MEALDERAETLDPAARKAGLKTCGRQTPSTVALDGIKGPLFEIQFTGFAKTFERRLALHRRRGTASPRAAADALIAVRSAIGVAQVGLDELLAPTWAEEPVDAYERAVLDFRAVEQRANAPFLDHAAVSPARKLSRTLGQKLRGGAAGEPA